MREGHVFTDQGVARHQQDVGSDVFRIFNDINDREAQKARQARNKHLSGRLIMQIAWIVSVWIEKRDAGERGRIGE